MRKTMVFACALTLSSIVAAPAFADCASDLKAAQETSAKLTDAKQKAEVDKHLAAAKTELAASNEKGCAMHVSEANAAAKAKPAMKP